MAHFTLDTFTFNKDVRKVSFGEYDIRPPLIKPSKLTYVENGGVGKELSDGWALNFAIGCIHACPFCYVDNIHKRFTFTRVGDVVQRPWGMYFLKPRNIDETIKKTPWKRWKGKLVMMSSTHDPYLPQLYPIPRKILEKALPAGVKFLIQTRSVLVTKDLDLLSRYKDQVILQVSIATLKEKFASIIEPRAPPPKARLEVLRKAKEVGLKAGVIVAPVFPPNKVREDVKEDLEMIMKELADIGVDQVFGEMLHERGMNMEYIESLLWENVKIDKELDEELGKMFTELLSKYHLRGKWWYEKH
ncbi:radical SAM protein [Acidianus two-tailed virus 2]|nr:radical SAM protein [Acidianus two-tailed virus 2]